MQLGTYLYTVQKVNLTFLDYQSFVLHETPWVRVSYITNSIYFILHQMFN